jgi:hypothetical protein
MDCIFHKVEDRIERRYGLVRLSDMYRDPLCQGEEAIVLRRCWAAPMDTLSTNLTTPVQYSRMTAKESSRERM